LLIQRTIFYNPEAAQAVNEQAAPLLDKLWADDTSALPDEVLSWLGAHTIAASTPTLGEARKALADVMPEPPYEPNVARRVAAAVEKIMEITTNEYSKLRDGDEMLVGLFTDVDQW
jgi:hypothetical protein